VRERQPALSPALTPATAARGRPTPRGG
jgi:hypothetical protein